MNMKDLHSHVSAVAAIGPVAASADVSVSDIDLAGFMAAEILIGVGIGGITFDATNKIEFTVKHSDDGVTYAAVDDDDVLGVTVAAGGIVKALVAAHAAAAVYRLGYVGGKRYLEIAADFSGTHGAATPIAVTVVKGRPESVPTADQA